MTPGLQAPTALRVMLSRCRSVRVRSALNPSRRGVLKYLADCVLGAVPQQRCCNRSTCSHSAEPFTTRLAARPGRASSRAAPVGCDEAMRRGLRCSTTASGGIVHHTATPTSMRRATRGHRPRHLQLSHDGPGLGDIATTPWWTGTAGVRRTIRRHHRPSRAATPRVQRQHLAVAMIGNFDEAPPTTVQLQAVGQLLGWRLAMDTVPPLGTWR